MGDNFSPEIQSIFSWKTTFILRFTAFFRERQLLSWHLGQSHFSGSGLRGHGQTVNVRYKQESFRWNLRKYYWALVKARIKVSIGRSKKQKDDVSWVGRVANGAWAAPTQQTARQLKVFPSQQWTGTKIFLNSKNLDKITRSTPLFNFPTPNLPSWPSTWPCQSGLHLPGVSWMSFNLSSTNLLHQIITQMQLEMSLFFTL